MVLHETCVQSANGIGHATVAPAESIVFGASRVELLLECLDLLLELVYLFVYPCKFISSVRA